MDRTDPRAAIEHGLHRARVTIIQGTASGTAGKKAGED